MAHITANDLKTKGIAAIEALLADHSEAIVSVRGRDRFVVMEIAQYNYLRVKQRGKMARESGKTASKTVHPDMCHDPVFCRRNLGCYLWILLPKSEGVIL